MTGSHEVRGSIPLGSTKLTHYRLTNCSSSLPKMGSRSLISEIKNVPSNSSSFDLTRKLTRHDGCIGDSAALLKRYDFSY
jgi:hypothetical protein